MKRILLLFAILLLTVPFVLAHETDEPHEEPAGAEESCSVEEAQAGAEPARGCSFPVSEHATVRERAIAQFRPGYEADAAGWWAAGVLGALVLAIAGVRWTKSSKKQRTPVFWLKALGGVVIAGIAVFILYSAYVYWYNDISVVGLETCDASGCRISMHWHAELEEMTVCGAKAERPWEEGDLAGPHTHKDNKIHVHTILPIDPTTKEILETTPLTLGGFFDAIGWQFNTTCFQDTCGTCNGAPATTKVWKNGELVEDNIRDVRWKDGDKFRVVFG